MVSVEDNLGNIDDSFFQSNPDYNTEGRIKTELVKCGKKITVNSELITIDSKILPDKEASTIINNWIEMLQKQFSKPLFMLHHEIDTRSIYVKQNESEIGNFIAEIIRLYFMADIAMINSGSIRTDCIIPNGIVSLGVIKRMFPFDYSLASIKIKGKDLSHLINSSVQEYPVLTGAFPIITGIDIEFCRDSNNKLMVVNLIDLQTGTTVDPEKVFLVLTRTKLVKGLNNWDFKDIYTDYVDLDSTIERILISMFEHLYEQNGFSNIWSETEKLKFGLEDSHLLKEFLKKICIQKDENQDPFENYAININSVRKCHMKIQ